jgi:hypothetical protein
VTYKPWDNVDYKEAAALYKSRFVIHQKLISFFRGGDVDNYVRLALGIEEDGGNYSAAEHGLGPKILHSSPSAAVFALANKLFMCETPEKVPEVIYKENLPYLKISVGSEMAALLRPDVFWVTNVRTIWAHLVMKHNDLQLANEELRLYRTREMPSEMEYQLWTDMHPRVGSSMQQLMSLSSMIARRQCCEIDNATFLWADAVADIAYKQYSRR